MMDKDFAFHLNAYLESECPDYGLEYDWEWCEDSELARVKISRDDKYSTVLHFRFDNEGKELEIEVSEDCWYRTDYYDKSVKHFWILVASQLFAKI